MHEKIERSGRVMSDTPVFSNSSFQRLVQENNRVSMYHDLICFSNVFELFLHNFYIITNIFIGGDLKKKGWIPMIASNTYLPSAYGIQRSSVSVMKKLLLRYWFLSSLSIIGLGCVLLSMWLYTR